MARRFGRWHIVIATLLGCGLWAAECPAWGGEAASAAPAKATGSLEFAGASNQFGLDLLAMLSEQDNAVFSPSCISTAFAMVYSGAKGKTAEQLAATLHFGVPPEKVPQAYGAFQGALRVRQLSLGARAKENDGYGLRVTEVLKDSPAAQAGIVPGDLLLQIGGRPIRKTAAYSEAIDQAGERAQLQWYSLAQGTVENRAVRLTPADAAGTVRWETANAVWLQKGVHFVPQYVELLKDAYGGHCAELDFKGDAEGARKTVNGWIAGKTEGQIPALLGEGAVDARSRLVLTNVVDFRGQWLRPFPSKPETPVTVTWRPTKKPAPAMEQSNHFRYAGLKRFQMVELRYQDTPLSLVILLPAPEVAWREFRKELKAATLQEGLSQLQPTLLRLRLPKFRVTKALALEKLLAEKMPEVFSEQADFRGISPQTTLKLSAVRHQAFLEIDEQGTRAGAATAVVVGLKSLPEAQFIADRPFLVLLRDPASQAILFLGQVTTL